MTKNEYREYFIKMKKYIKLSSFCKECDIYSTHLSAFLKDEYHSDIMSINKLDRLYNTIQTFFKEN